MMRARRAEPPGSVGGNDPLFLIDVQGESLYTDSAPGWYGAYTAHVLKSCL